MEPLTSANPYDEVLYPGHPYPQTHPDRLATIGRLFGMNPAPVDGCRVLELGCGDGGNLIPMAYALPRSEFVGIDLGARSIAKGQETIHALALPNIDLRCLDILEAGADLGKFDYILAHGVYSWVPAEVQDRILAICSANLNPNGIAYISYLAYPGAHLRAMLAELLRYSVHRAATPAEQIHQARAMLALLGEAHPAVRQEAAALAGRSDASLIHDELGAFQSPVYFSEFIRRAAGHRLQYLGEADFFEMIDASQPEQARAMLREWTGGLIEKEQLLDFLKCRRFRQTLLCRSDVRLRRGIQPAQIRDFYIGVRQPSTHDPGHPIGRIILEVLGTASPGVLSFDDLKARVPADAGDDLLCDIILAFFSCDLVQLHVHAPSMARSVSSRPRASRLARRQARHEPYVTNLCHRTVHVEDELSRRLLLLLDGTRDREALARETAEEGLDRALNRLTELALLEE
jgi:SAM-dependent methyltransferase/methyltransferase-like protein